MPPYLVQRTLLRNEEWTAANNTTTIDLNGVLGFTTCPHTKSCDTNHQGGSGSSEVVAHLEAAQKSATGAVCQTTRSPDVDLWVSNATHHFSWPLALPNVPVSATCGSRNFYLRIYVHVVDGNPIKIDGNSDDGTDVTYAFAVNSNLTSTTSVPPVTGLSLDPSTGQGSAADALRNAGLVTGQVGSIYDGHPAGTVLQQEAVGYTVEPAGSPVNLVVSLGPPATVSDVIDFDPTSAGNAIRADGLVPDFTYKKLCSDPGYVVSQNPSAGTVLPQGSTVQITVDSGTRRTCPPPN